MKGARSSSASGRTSSRASSARSRSRSSPAVRAQLPRTARPPTTASLTVDRQGRRRAHADAAARRPRSPATTRYVDERGRELRRPRRRRSSPRSRPATSRRPRTLFGPTRVHYETIEPVAESFGDLDPEIDARVNDVATGPTVDRLPPHRADPLGEGHDRRARRPIADKLLADVTTLDAQDRRRSSYQPAQLANGAVELLNEVAALEDHRRGGPLLAHRPLRLRRPTSTARGGVRAAAPGARRARATQQLVDHDRRALRRRRRRGSTRTSAPTPLGFALYDELTPADRRAFAAAGRRARRAALDRRGEGQPQLMATTRHAGAAALLAGGGAVGLAAPRRRRLRARRRRRRDDARRAGDVVPFYGAHQAGIATPAQDRLVFGAFDLTLDATARAARPAARRGPTRPRRMTAGRAGRAAVERRRGAAGRHRRGARAGAGAPDRHVRLRAASSSDGAAARARARAGRALRAARPAARRRARPGPLAAATSASRPARTTRRSRSTPSATSRASAAARSSCAGRSSASAARRRRPRRQATPRNLMGFKDGTNNLNGDDDGGDGPLRLGRRRRAAGAGSAAARYLVARRIRMLIEAWDRDRARRPGARRSAASRLSGAPLDAARSEHDPVDLARAAPTASR